MRFYWRGVDVSKVSPPKLEPLYHLVNRDENKIKIKYEVKYNRDPKVRFMTKIFDFSSKSNHIPQPQSTQYYLVEEGSSFDSPLGLDYLKSLFQGDN